MKKVKNTILIFNYLLILSAQNGYAIEKTQLYCVENFNQYEKLSYLGKNIIVEGNFINLSEISSNFLTETKYFKLNEDSLEQQFVTGFIENLLKEPLDLLKQIIN